MSPPRHNPKRAKGKTYDVKEEGDPPEKYKYKRSKTPIWMAIAFVGISLFVVFLIVQTFTPRDIEVIEKNDRVLMSYQVYTSEDAWYNESDLVISVSTEWVNVISRYDGNITGDLVLGLYNEIIGKSAPFSNAILLSACVDNNKDEYHDPSESGDNPIYALSYGIESLDGVLLFNKSIVIEYTIHSIQKANITESVASSGKKIRPIQTKNLKDVNNLGFEIFFFYPVDIVCQTFNLLGTIYDFI